jgi:hypothetical protein
VKFFAGWLFVSWVQRMAPRWRSPRSVVQCYPDEAIGKFNSCLRTFYVGWKPKTLETDAPDAA